MLSLRILHLNHSLPNPFQVSINFVPTANRIILHLVVVLQYYRNHLFSRNRSFQLAHLVELIPPATRVAGLLLHILPEDLALHLRRPQIISHLQRLTPRHRLHLPMFKALHSMASSLFQHGVPQHPQRTKKPDQYKPRTFYLTINTITSPCSRAKLQNTRKSHSPPSSSTDP